MIQLFNHFECLFSTSCHVNPYCDNFTEVHVFTSTAIYMYTSIWISGRRISMSIIMKLQRDNAGTHLLISLICTSTYSRTYYFSLRPAGQLAKVPVTPLPASSCPGYGYRCRIRRKFPLPSYRTTCSQTQIDYRSTSRRSNFPSLCKHCSNHPAGFSCCVMSWVRSPRRSLAFLSPVSRSRLSTLCFYTCSAKIPNFFVRMLKSYQSSCIRTRSHPGIDTLSLLFQVCRGSSRPTQAGTQCTTTRLQG